MTSTTNNQAAELAEDAAAWRVLDGAASDAAAAALGAPIQASRDDMAHKDLVA